MYLLGSLYKRFRDFNYIMLFYNVKVLGQIHDNSDPLEYYQNTLDILKILINALTSSQRETIDANSCHEGFMRWNYYWKIFASPPQKKKNNFPSLYMMANSNFVLP